MSRSRKGVAVIATNFTGVMGLSLDEEALLDISDVPKDEGRSLPHREVMIERLDHELTKLASGRSEIIVAMGIIRAIVQDAPQPWYLLGAPSVGNGARAPSLYWRERQTSKRKPRAPWITWDAWPEELTNQNMAQQWRAWFDHATDIALTLNMLAKVNASSTRALRDMRETLTKYEYR